jgi:hypothetical protein
VFHLLVLLVVVGVSALVFVLVTGFSAPRKLPAAVAGGAGDGAAARAAVALGEIERHAERLLAERGIAIEARSDTAPGERTLVGVSGDAVVGGRYIALCIEVPGGEAVPTERLLGFRDEVRAAGASRGLLITGGVFPSDAAFLVDDAPISLLRVTPGDGEAVIVDAAAVRGRAGFGV